MSFGRPLIVIRLRLVELVICGSTAVEAVLLNGFIGSQLTSFEVIMMEATTFLRDNYKGTNLPAPALVGISKAEGGGRNPNCTADGGLYDCDFSAEDSLYDCDDC